MDPVPAPTDRARAWRTAALLACLVLATALARSIGLGAELPTSILADEGVYVQHVAALTSGAEDPAALPGAGWYPHLVSRIAAATWREVPCTAAELDAHLACAARLEIVIRGVVAALSLLVVPATWLLVRAFASNATALLAAALVATSLFGQVHGQQGRPHAAMLGFAIAAIALAVHLQRRPTFPLALATGISAGLAIAALQSGFALIGPILAAIVLARDATLPRRIGLLAACALPCVLAFVWSYPFLFVERVDPAVQRGHGLLGEGTFGLALLDGTGFRVLADALWTYEPVGLIAAGTVAVIAIARKLRRRDVARDSTHQSSLDPRTWSDALRSAAVVAAFVVPYVVVFGLYERTYPRYALPLMPFVAWSAATVLTPRGERAHGVVVPRDERARSLVAWIPALVLIAAQGALVAKLALVRARPDTLALAARWIEREVPRSARIALPINDDLPLLRLPAQRAQLSPALHGQHHHWRAYQSHLGPGPWDASARDISSVGGRSAEALSSAVLDGGYEYFVWRLFGDPNRVGLEEARRRIAQRATLVATIRPVDDGDPTPFVPEEMSRRLPRQRTWIERLVRADAVGNVVEIWRIDAAR